MNTTTTVNTIMAPEWMPHERTWMSFPTPNDTFGQSGSHTLNAARQAWTNVARTIAKYEPVTMIAAPNDVEVARDRLGAQVEIVVTDLNDAWLRDSGPTFVHRTDGELVGVNWIFNGWGAQSWAAWENDAKLGRFVVDKAGSQIVDSPLVNEGGAFHVDGKGSILLTETVQLDPDRNPGATKESVEAEIHAQLGTTHAIWLPRGLTRDYNGFGTRGHVDIVASFTESGAVLLHRQNNPEHPDFEVTQQLRAVLETSVDATGQPLEIIDVPAPTILQDEEGWVDYSYINHYVANGVVVLCAFDDEEADQRAAEILASAYPGRVIELVDARDIFAYGGGIHCITQQQPQRQNKLEPGN